MGFTDSFNKISYRSTKRNLYTWIHDDHVLDENYMPKSIEPNKGYFNIRLTEMFLRDAREYWREFVPMAVLMSDFLYASESQSPPKRHAVPFIVGSHLLKELQQYVEGKPVEYRNTKVTGWVPYRGDDIGLFVGLYRMQVDNLANNLLEVLQNIVKTFDITQISRYLDVSHTICDGLSRLLGMEELEFRAGAKDHFSDNSNDADRFREGYRAYINCETKDLSADELWVKDGQLFIGQQYDTGKPLNQYDYCLVRIQLSDTRNDYETLDFHRTWLSARDRIISGEHAVGEALHLECLRQISESPDLTEDHQEGLIMIYLAHYHRAVERYNKIHGYVPALSATVTRGPEGILTPKAIIQKTVYLAKNGGVSNAVLGGLENMRENWKQIFGAEGKDEEPELTQITLSNQLKSLTKYNILSGANPRDLADAIAVAALSAG